MSIEIRQFNLINGEGETYTLTVSNKYTGFLGIVDGLGYEKSPEYQKIGTEYEQLTNTINQGVIAGTIQFFQPYAYQEFTRFARFCQDNDLTLYYQIPTGLFLKKGSITKIDKSEGNDSLRVKVEFTPKTLWYQEIEQKSTQAFNGAIQHQEEVTDPDTGVTTIQYVISGYSFEFDGVSVISDSNIESPCHFAIKMPAYTGNLTWTQEVDGTQVMTGTLSNITLSDGDVLHIRTDTNPYRIYKESSQGVQTDLYSKSDFSTKRFPFIYKGVNTLDVSQVTLADISGDDNYLSIEGKILYETV